MEYIPTIKILVISHEYPPIGGGGGRVIQDICEGIASEKYKFHVLTAYWDNLPKFEESENLTIERIRSHRTQAYRADLITMACFVWKSFWRSLQIIRKWHPDIIHAHFAVPGGASAAAASLLTHTPYIITVHGGDVPGGAPEKTKKWFRFILPFTHFIWKKAEKIIAVSKQSRQLAQVHYHVNITVIPNGIDTSGYLPLSLDVHDPPCIMYIGRFSPEKNAKLVPKILSHLRDLKWECVMVGDGPQMTSVQAQIAKNQLDSRFELPGWASPKEVDKLLLKCDILLMPSLREGMPMAGLQGLASGSALVMSNVGACSDMVEVGKNGFLIEAGDEEGYAHALRMLLSDHKILLQYKKNSAQKSQEFDIKKVVNSYKDVYQSILKGKI
ncbi:MAG: glycosyltransferase family 4 protein [Anaerolineaceae bacterium]|nr:glycosyltransferase family 4 protein [Anaerolineaceae bacterium]